MEIIVITAWLSRTILIFNLVCFMFSHFFSVQQFHAPSEKAKLKQKAVILEQKGAYEEALIILQSLTDEDYFVPARDEFCYRIPAYIPATRQLAIMRCHLAIGNTKEAVDIAWIILEKQWDNDNQVKEIIVENAVVQGGYDKIRNRLEVLLNNTPNNFMAKDSLAYLDIVMAAQNGDYEYIVEGIATGPMDRSSDGRQWIKKKACFVLAQGAEESLHALLQGLENNRESMWIVYALGITGDSRTIIPLFDYLLYVNRNYYARIEAAEALARLGSQVVEYCLDQMESPKPIVRERAAQVLSYCAGHVIESSDPNLQRILEALNDPKNRGNKPHVVNIQIFLLRAIAATRNCDYVTSLKKIDESVGTFNKHTERQMAFTLAYLGDFPGIEPILGELEDHHSPGLLSRFQDLAQMPNASVPEILRWYEEKKSQQIDDPSKK